MAKTYYLSDLSKIQSLAVEMGLRVWRVENIRKEELIKINPTVKAPEALEKIFHYLNSEFVEDGKYILIGKTGQKSVPTTELIIVKGDAPESTGASFNTTLAYKDYNAVIQENAKLKAENYYFEEQIKVLHEQIAELREELNEEEDEDGVTPAKSSIYEDLTKEYAPQLFNLITQYFGPKSQPVITTFADAPPSSAAQKIIRFTPEYANFWRNCRDQNAVNSEFQYLTTNRPDKVQEFTQLFSHGDQATNTTTNNGL